MFTMIRNVGLVIVLVCVWYVVCNKDEETKEKQTGIVKEKYPKIFRATKEWQTIKKGQPVPQGLHIRLNLATGVREAKLLDEDEKHEKGALSLHEEHTMNFVKKTKFLKRSEPKNVMKNIKGEDIINPDDLKQISKTKFLKRSELKNAMKNIKGDDIINPDDLKQISKTKFRSYEDIEKELEEIKLIPKTDAQLLQMIVDDFRKIPKNDPLRNLRLLEDLEFLAHQLDNAVEFTRQNGFVEIIYVNFNSSDVSVKMETLKLFSSLVQNNPKVKVDAVETGSVNLLLRLLSLDPDENVKIRGVTAVSCLLRRFPYAQLKFVENGGLMVISQLFEINNIILKVKLATLVCDLLTESRDTDDGQEYLLTKQYGLVNLQRLLLEHNWCKSLRDLLEILVITDTEGHDAIEKCLLSIRAIAMYCPMQFRGDLILTLQKRYALLAKVDESKDEEVSNTAYYNEVSGICADILIFVPIPTYFKTEM